MGAYFSTCVRRVHASQTIPPAHPSEFSRIMANPGGLHHTIARDLWGKGGFLPCFLSDAIAMARAAARPPSPCHQRRHTLRHGRLGREPPRACMCSEEEEGPPAHVPATLGKSVVVISDTHGASRKRFVF